MKNKREPIMTINFGASSINVVKKPLTLIEFKNRIDFYLLQKRYEDAEVCIPNNKGGMGGTSATNVVGCQMGIDWDSGRFFIFPENKMIEGTNSIKQNILTDKEIEEYIWEEMSTPLSQVDIDVHSVSYVHYLECVKWAKWGRDNHKGL